MNIPKQLCAIKFMKESLLDSADEIWVLEYSHGENQFHIHTLLNAIETNQNNIQNEVFNDYQIIFASKTKSFVYEYADCLHGKHLSGNKGEIKK